MITMASIRSFSHYAALPPGGILPKSIQGILSGIGFLGAWVADSAELRVATKSTV